MKKIISVILFFLLLSSGLMGQNSGKGFNFQAVARNSDGSIKAEQTVNLVISIYPSFEKTAVLYTENNAANTDKFGVFSLVVGNGVYEAGSAATFEEIDFSGVEAYLNVVLKDGGNDIEIVHSPMLSVPYAESSTQADNGIPIGAIIPYAGEVPDNSDDITVYGCKGTWRLCNGAEYDPAEFVSLLLVLNDAWGTNRLPDMRGMFLRGTSNLVTGGWADPDAASRVRKYDGGNIGNTVGSYQGFAMENATGTVGIFSTYRAYTRPSTGVFLNTWQYGTSGIAGGGTDQYDKIDFDLSRMVTTSTETRPINAYVNYIIRVK